MRPVLLLLPFLATSLAQSILKGRLATNGSLQIDTTVSLTNPRAVVTVPVLEDGSFSIRVPEPGEYVLKVQSRKFNFLTYALRLSKDDDGKTVNAQVYQPGPASFDQPGTAVPHPLVIPAVGETVYFEPPASFDIVKMATANPLILLMGVGALMTITMPWVLKNLDPETLKEVTETQEGFDKQIAAFTGLANPDIAGATAKYLAGSTPVEEEAPPPPAYVAPPEQRSGASKGGSKKRR